MRLVLLHALPLDGRMWDAVQSTFNNAFAPTLYELGGSVQEWAHAIIDECSDEELLVVGNSVGGSCALEVARAAPDRVRGVVLVGAKVSVRRDLRLRDEAVGVLRRDGIAAAWDRYWKPHFRADASPAVVAGATKLALEQDVGDLVTGVRAFHDRRDHSEWLATWSGWLVSVTGAEDRTPTPRAAAASVTSERGQQLVIDRSGHYVPLEQPQMLSRIIQEQTAIVVGGGPVTDPVLRTTHERW
jgi:pimeloyl-ACP methyl ester carboxylesterase